MNFLFPFYLKKPGFIILLIGLVLFMYLNYFNEEPEFFSVHYPEWVSIGVFGPQMLFGEVHDNLFNELVSILILCGGFLLAFSKEKNEDEFIHKIRLDSLIWAMYVNYAIVLFGILFFYIDHFFSFMVYNLFTILFLFIIKFYWTLYKLKRSNINEE